jgi:predicted Zn-dependent peptidase
VIEQLTPQQMRDFHGYWYQPQRMTAAVVGNLPVRELIGIVTEAFDQLYQSGKPPQENDNRQEPQPEPAFGEIVRREYVDEALQQARLVMMWRVPGILELSETYPLDVLAAVLGQGKMSRLFRDLREERGLVSQIGVSNLTQGIQGAFYISAQLPQENLEEVEQAIAEQLRTIQRESVAEQELARIRTQVVNRFIFANERPSDRANLYGYYYSQMGNLQPAFDYPNLIQSLTVEDIREAACKYLSADAYGMVTIKPGK